MKKKFWGKHQGPLGRYTKIQVPAGPGNLEFGVCLEAEEVRGRKRRLMVQFLGSWFKELFRTGCHVCLRQGLLWLARRFSGQAMASSFATCWAEVGKADAPYPSLAKHGDPSGFTSDPVH